MDFNDHHSAHNVDIYFTQLNKRKKVVLVFNGINLYNILWVYSMALIY